MNEPITRAEFRDFLIHKERVDLLHPGTSPALIFDSWCEQHRTESASPPRVPGASAQFAKVGVQSGPGQPIPVPPHVPDIADALDGWAAQFSEPENINARHLREAAAEIRRLRAEIAAMDSLLTRTFDDLGVLREQVKTERRAGIEAAAQYCIEGDVLLPDQAKAMVRALADTPPAALKEPANV